MINEIKMLKKRVLNTKSCNRDYNKLNVMANCFNYPSKLNFLGHLAGMG